MVKNPLVKKYFILLKQKIKSNQKIFNSLVGALAKNGSFGFLGWLVCRQKPNVPFVGWLSFYTDR